MAGGDKINIDWAGAGGLIDESECEFSCGGGLALIFEGELLEAGGGVANKDGVLRGWDKTCLVPAVAAAMVVTPGGRGT